VIISHGFLILTCVNSEVVPPCDVKCSAVMDNITKDVDDVNWRLNNLKVYKSYGPDMIHPIILKELQNENNLVS